MTADSMDPLARALDLAREFTRVGTRDVDEFLAAHTELRELLEPLLVDGDPAADGEPLRTFGDFDVLSEIGRGGMGVVYEALQRSLGRRVALKLLSPDATPSPDRLLGLRREAQVAAALDHPGIAKVFALAEQDGDVAFAMEFVDGRPLDAVLARLAGHESVAAATRVTEFARAAGIDGDPPASWGRSHVDAAVELTRQLAVALAHAHERGVVHRDVKPGNVILTPAGTAVLTDFGLATEARHRAKPGLGFAGTYGYAAPEQLDGASIDERTDVYALGVTLYQLLTLQRPFPDVDGHEPSSSTARRAAAETPTGPSAVNARVSADLDAVVLHALAPRPTDRYATAAAFAADLTNVLEGRPVSVRDVAPHVRLGKWCRRNPLATSLVTVLGAATIVVSILATLTSNTLHAYENLWAGASLDMVRQRGAAAHPAGPETLAELDAIVRIAETEIVPRRETIDATIATLRARATTAVPESTNRPRHPALAIAAGIDGTIRRVEAELVAVQGADNMTADEIAAAEQLAADTLDGLRSRRDALLDRAAAYASAGFADRDDQELHDRLEQQSFAIAEFERRELRDLVERRDRAATLAARTIDAHATAWAAAAKRVAEHTDFAGFTLEPQPGLVPLGPDPQSGLEEFCVADTGAEPARAADGELVLGREHGIVLVLLPGRSAFESFVAGQSVDLTPFFVAKFETSRAQWVRIADDIPGLRLEDGGIADLRNLVQLDKPANGVSWTMVTELGRRTGLELPTAVQWEYAARFGGEPPIGDDAALARVANLCDQSYAAEFALTVRPVAFDDGHARLAPAVSMAASPAGLHHLLGNVSEWCRDPYRRGEPCCPGTGAVDAEAWPGAKRWICGGAWNGNNPLDPFNRAAPGSATRSLGVRYVRPVRQEPKR